ncbi:MAG: hypothetical protein CBC13_06545 [Planctomycetia bacterium TMED53]|nr:MAG: hypothetical protein CBC13_06545 [Planctomycetia bacterium TMED53]
MFNNNEKTTKRALAACLFLFMGAILGSTHVGAQIADIPVPGSQAVVILGEIEHVFVDDMDDMWSAGWIVADGTAVRIPSGLLIDLPMNRLSLRDIMAGASPECAANGESGLASTDECLRNKGLQGGGAQILANRQADGQVIAGDVFLNKSMTGNVAGGIVPPTVGGYVSFIDYEQGYFVVNGAMGERPLADGGSDRKGVICRINDPDMVQTIQNGLACMDGMPNCSADPRFTIDPGSYSFAFSTGVPSCIPSTNNSFGNRDDDEGANAVTGAGDEFCPMWNRAFTGPINRTVPDSRRFVPLIPGDPIGLEGNFEVVDGVRFFSAYAAVVQLGLKTRQAGNQPDYMTWDEVECDVPPFDNARIKSLAIAFTSIDDIHIDAFRLHIDPETGEGIEYIWGTSLGNLGARFNGIAPNAGHITKFGYDVDFLLGAPSAHGPCLNLINGGHNVCPQGGTMEEEVALMAPAAREVIGKTHHSYTLNPGVFPRDILGNPAQHGEYVAGAGLGHPEFVEVNLDKTGYPFIFEGIPWNLDRRLGPGGCDEAVGCEDLPLGSLPLSPFPSAGDPDWVVHSIGNGIPPFAAERLTAYHPFGSNDFVDPYIEASPAGPGLPLGIADGLTGEHCDVTNNIPFASDDPIAATEDSATPISNASLLLNDSDPDLDKLRVFHYDGKSLNGGSVTPSGDGVIYQSAPDYHGSDEFQYSISDGHGGIAKARVVIEVAPQADAPEAQDDFLTTGLDAFLFTADLLLGNDSDVDGDALTLTAINMIDALASPGTMENDGAGNWTFTPAGAGSSSWEYVIEDSTGLPASAVVTFHAGNQAPVTTNDVVLTDEDVALEIDVLANDSDPEGDPLTVSEFSAAGFGTVELLPSGTLLYTPDLDQNGIDTFTYTATDGKGTFTSGAVSVSVIAVNDPPRLGADIAVTLEDQAVEINVLANDYDPEGHAMTVSLPIVNAFNGAVSLLPGGVIRFVPFPDMSVGVADNFMYIVTDSQGAVSTAMVSIEVTPVNDAPMANPDSAVTLEDVPTVINVLANDGDVDNDLLRVVAVNVPGDFPATVNWATNGSITIQPDQDYNDILPKVFTYVLSDGFLTDTAEVSLQVISINDAPVAADDLGNQVDEDGTVAIDVLANDSDVDGDAIQLAAVTNGLLGLATIDLGGTISYTPFPNANGLDSFTYTVTDNNGGQASATVEVEILPVNDAPVAGTLPIFPLPEDSLKTISALTILQGASDADMDELLLTNVGQPSNGQVDINVDAQGIISSLVYTPDPNFFGIDEFLYEVHDLSLHGAGTIRLNVLPVNDVPVANNDSGIIVEAGSSIGIAPLLNDEDVDGDELQLLGIISGPFHGSMVINADGTLTYNADGNYEGEDSMIYRISDNHGGMATASILVDVIGQTSAAASMIRSDANADGQLDVSDPVETVLHLFQGRGVACLAALDANDDEQIDIADVVFTLNTLFTNGQVPSAPYPFCGEDPTSNVLPCDGFGLCD